MTARDYTPGVDEFVKAALTDEDGKYLFADLDEGDYIVVIPAENFIPGGPLNGLESSLGGMPAPRSRR